MANQAIWKSARSDAVNEVDCRSGKLGYGHRSDRAKASPSQFDNFVYGAPAMAPLLFPNLVLLTFIGLWVLRRRIPADNARTVGQDGERGSDAPPLSLGRMDA
jgi:hypothetical protein